MRDVAATIAALPRPSGEPLPAPAYVGTKEDARPRVGLAVEAMKRHLSDEGWQLFDGLAHAGYVLHGQSIGPSLVDVTQILARENPAVVVVQDKREWMGLTAGGRHNVVRAPVATQFRNLTALRGRLDTFRLTVVKDAHADLALHRQSAEEAGVNAWITPYNPRIVCHLCPILRPRYIVRTWHTVDASLVPPFSPDGRAGCLLSGAVSSAYPLRSLLVQRRTELPHVTYLPHPGYSASGCKTPEFLRTLSRFRVAVCTSSKYGYALRKLIEATACGCSVITDLPTDEVLPGGIDENLVRIPHTSTPRQVGDVIDRLCADYDPERQREFAARACRYFDWRAEGVRLAAAIEAARRTYHS